MKRIFASLLLAAGMMGTCLGQGTVRWDAVSLSPGAITAQTNSAQYSPNAPFDAGLPNGGLIGDTAAANSGLHYYYELLYNTAFTGSQVSTPSWAQLFGGTWLDTGLKATNALNNHGVLVAVNPNIGAVVPWANGVTNNIMLVGWSANLGTSWLTVSNQLANWDTFGAFFVSGDVYFGESATGYITPGSSIPGVSISGTFPTSSGLPINSPNMQLYIMPIPEPSTFALAGLSALSLFLFRRRK